MVEKRKSDDKPGLYVGVSVSNNNFDAVETKKHFNNTFVAAKFKKTVVYEPESLLPSLEEVNISVRSKPRVKNEALLKKFSCTRFSTLVINANTVKCL